ncbi:MAG TPA: OmpA family protein [Saprospiraceae bacterium]|nr:OmpA family protein [Saprospiraceae bacterium]HMQ82971.1 OmpA family protein [Saprospiraceae bacterium]
MDRFSVFFCVTLLMACFISNNNSLQAQTTDSRRLQLLADIEKDPESPLAYYELAQLYADEGNAFFEADAAYLYLKKAQRYFRKEKEGTQKRLEKAGMDGASIRQLKEDLRQKGLEAAIGKNNSQALLDYMEQYKPLPDPLETAAQKAFLKARLVEIVQQKNYDAIKEFALAKQAELKEYAPELYPQLLEDIYTSYFSQKDSSSISNLLFLLRDFPPLASRIDRPLSEAVLRKPLISAFEAQLKGLDVRALPLTLGVIYQYHYVTGDESDIMGFISKYPIYREWENVDGALTIARMAPDLDIPYTSAAEDSYVRYMELARGTHLAFACLQSKIRPALEARNWTQAIAEVEKMATYFDENDPRILQLLEILRRPEEGIKAINLGAVVNSPFREYSPVISADNKSLYFCKNGGNNEEIYFSQKENDAWTKPAAVEELNTDTYNEAPLALSADGTTLLIFNEGKVLYVDKGIEGWQAPRPFFSEELAPEWQGGTSMASNREVVIFAARSNQVIGIKNDDNIDLFVSERLPDGTWSSPVNLGNTINTPFEDRAPFLHPDMRTLYFSSAGHSGLGRLDVYMSRRIGDGWLEWTTPVNLGKEVNSIGQDWGYRISTDGKAAYFTSYDKANREDIFEISVPENMRPAPVVTISGVLKTLDDKPLGAELLLEDLSTGESVGYIQTDPQSGEFFVTLPLGKLYSYTVIGDQLYPISNNIDLREGTPDFSIYEDIEVPQMEEIEAGDLVLPIKNLFFDTDKYQIKPESFVELNRLADLVKERQLRIEIAGHTDNTGTAEYNQTLSQNRAAAVRDYFIAQGCATENIAAKGYGLNQPIESNAMEKGRAMNRRVEIRFQKAGF